MRTSVKMGTTWPRRYTRAELDSIVKSHPVAQEKLQEAVEGYQWASLQDEGTFPNATNEGRREQLNQILKLCAEGGTHGAIEAALNELDGPTSQRLGPIHPLDTQRLARAVRYLLEKTPKRGPDPKRARRQLIGDLAGIFELATGQRPSRRVHDQEYGPFRDFVIAALKPIDTWHAEFVASELERTIPEQRDRVRKKLKKASAWQGCEADIKVVLQQRNKRSHNRKLAARTRL